MAMEEKSVRLTFLGDIMLDWNMSLQLDRYVAQTESGYRFDDVFAPVEGLLKDSDYVMGNLETPIAKDNKNLTNQQWEFCTPGAFAKAVHQMGVHWVSTANNHCLDRGIDGLVTTISELDKIGLAHSGTYAPKQKRKPLIVDVEGIKLGLLSYTYGTNAVSNGNYLPFKHRRLVDLVQEQEGRLAPWDPLTKFVKKHPKSKFQILRDCIEYKLLSTENGGRQWYEKETWDGYRLWLLKKDLKWLRKHGAEKIVIFLHIGGQYNIEPNSYTKRVTKWLEDQGVDFVIANHEHVVHGSKIHAAGFTTYALGNFLGSAGTMKAPYDRRSEYSIAVHAYLDKATKELMKVTYSVLRIVYTDEGKFQVWPVYDLLNGQTGGDYDAIRDGALQCACDFSGTLPCEIEGENLLWSK